MNTLFLLTPSLLVTACQLNMPSAQISRFIGNCDEYERQHSTLIEQCEEQGISCEDLDQLIEILETECPGVLEQIDADSTANEDDPGGHSSPRSYAEKLHDLSIIAYTGDALVMVATEPLMDENEAESAFLPYEYRDDSSGSS